MRLGGRLAKQIKDEGGEASVFAGDVAQAEVCEAMADFTARTYGRLDILHNNVGIGAPGTPTPSGRFWIREKFRVRGAPAYGPYAIGTSAYAPFLTDWPGGGVVGLHGTNAPGLIPGRPSHGCIRLPNAEIAKLYRLAPRGTPIWIH